MRVVASALVVLCIVLAGCSGGDSTSTSSSDGTSGPSGTGSTSTSRSGTSTTATATTTTANPSSNTPPSGSLSVSVPAGAVPLNVTFTIDGTDRDGDDLSWKLDVTGDGEPESTTEAPAAFPATYSHTYAVEGVYNATLTITDGKTDSKFHVLVNATSGDFAKQSVTGGWTASSAGCGGPYDSWVFGTPADGTGWKEFAVDAGTYGRPYQLDFTSSSIATVGGVDFYDDAGTTRVGGKFDTASFADVVPPGAIHGLVTDCGGLNFSFTYQTS